MDLFVFLLSQTAPGTSGDVFLLLVVIVAICSATAAGWWFIARRRLASADAAFLAVGEMPGVRAVRGDDLAELADALRAVFNQMQMSMYARHQTLLGAFRYPDPDLKVSVVHVVLGLERSNANHQTLDKVVVLIEGLPRSLPSFSLMPNSYLMRKFNRQQIFPPTNRFGAQNMVRGADHAGIRRVFTDAAQQLFLDNRNTVVQSHGGRLVFYLHDEAVIPPDMPAFLADALALARIAREQAATAGEPTLTASR
jgi:hypothetical protein